MTTFDENQEAGIGVALKPWPIWPQPGEDERQLILRALDERWDGVDAPLVVEAEQAFAEYVQAGNGISVSNGTISLEIALQAVGVSSGDEVIVPPYTFLATASAVVKVNALPVFVDIDPDNWCVDPEAVLAAITPRTRAVIAVHLGGHPADLDRLQQICRTHGLALIEDAAHAHGAVWRGRPVGTVGDFGSWSFQGSKNISTGEGGLLTTNRDDLAAKARSLRNCGRRQDGPWYEHEELGGNHRITSFQAALLLAGLKRLPKQIIRREESAAHLDRELATLPGLRPLARDPRVDVHAHHLYIIRYDMEATGISRDDLVAGLNTLGVPASAGYPIPLYAQRVFREARFDRAATGWEQSVGDVRYDQVRLPVCERACAQAIWLHHEILLANPPEINRIVEAAAHVLGAS
jgi:dTDP-4-amino-4,6-dideoxygalactose transaminase